MYIGIADTTVVSACEHTYIRAYIHMYVHTYIYTYIRAYIHMCIHTYVHTYCTRDLTYVLWIAVFCALGPGGDWIFAPSAPGIVGLQGAG